MDHPVEGMPRIHRVYENKDYLIVIEEFIWGRTLEETMKEGAFAREKAAQIIRDLCLILTRLHQMDQPIIHRDIKPSNVILDQNHRVYLLDINAAKYYKEECRDTHFAGTPFFASPEQLGFGFQASSQKTDIYGLGMLLNYMLTGDTCKNVEAAGDLWPLIERCTRLEAKERFSDQEFLQAIEKFTR